MRRQAGFKAAIMVERAQQRAENLSKHNALQCRDNQFSDIGSSFQCIWTGHGLPLRIIDFFSD
jgi:hypothetical protein